jgi:hypothetical protein
VLRNRSPGGLRRRAAGRVCATGLVARLPPTAGPYCRAIRRSAFDPQGAEVPAFRASAIAEEGVARRGRVASPAEHADGCCTMSARITSHTPYTAPYTASPFVDFCLLPLSLARANSRRRLQLPLLAGFAATSHRVARSSGGAAGLICPATARRLLGKERNVKCISNASRGGAGSGEGSPTEGTGHGRQSLDVGGRR